MRLADKPLLLELCRGHWKVFLEDWRRGKPLLVERLGAQTRALKIQEIVRQQEHRLGRPVRDFHYRLDFTRWPSDYRREVAEDHAVLGVAYLEASRLEDLRAVVESRMAALA